MPAGVGAWIEKANIVRRELGSPTTYVPVPDAKLQVGPGPRRVQRSLPIRPWRILQDRKSESPIWARLL